MRFGMIGPLMETPGAPGGGGPADGGGAPAGASVPVTPATPTVWDASDDSLIRLKGSDKPIKFGDHVKGLQSQATRAAQEAARLRKELSDRDTRLKALEQQSQQAPAQPGGDVFAALRQLPYLKGEDAVQLVQEIGAEIQQRDQVLLAALKKLQSMEQVLNGLNDTHSSSLFEAKINKWLQDGGYPSEAAQLAKEIYLAYEGEDLDNEFPRMFEERWNQMEKIMEARRQNKLRAARPAPFLPGRGGEAKPSKPMEIKPASGAREVADQLFQAFAESDT